MLALESLITFGDEAIERGEYSEAFRYFRRAYNFSPDAIDPQRAMVRLSLAMGRADEALGLAQELLAQHHTNGLAYITLAQVHLARGDTERARRALAETAKFKQLAVQRERAALLYALEEWPACLAVATAVVSSAPQDAATGALASRAAIELNNPGLAWEFAVNALHADPNNPYMYCVLAQAHLAMHNPQHADLCLTKATQRFGERTDFLTLRARAAAAMSNHQAAFELLSQAVTRPDATENAWLALANAALETQHFEHAKSAAERLSTPEGSLLLGRAFAALGQYDEATSTLRRAVRRLPADWRPSFELGLVLERRNLHWAAWHFDRATCLAPEAKRWLPRAHHAWCLHQLGDPAAALKLAALIQHAPATHPALARLEMLTAKRVAA